MSLIRKLSIPLVLVTVALLLAACGSSSEQTPSASQQTSSPSSTNGIVTTPIDARYLPVVISSDLAVGEERFQVGLIDQQDNNTPINGAKLHLTFYVLSGDGKTSTEKFEADPEAVTIQKSYTHTHEDGTVETHHAGETGAYVTHINFDEAGFWGVAVTGTLADGTSIVANGEQPVRPYFQVSEHSAGLGVGDPAPASKQKVLSDVSDIRSIDTSQNPIPDEHNMTVAQAITSGKPTVIAFATPAFCVSQLCGPTKEIFDGLYQRYKGQANFVHIEPYDVDKVRAGQCPNLGDCVVPAMNDFKLSSEPWVFIIDAQGKVASKYDGVISEKELQDGLLAVLGGAPAATATP